MKEIFAHIRGKKKKSARLIQKTSYHDEALGRMLEQAVKWNFYVDALG